MVSIAAFKKMALSFPGTTESPHFEKTSFRINQKIFATLEEKNKTAVVKLGEIDQSVFCAVDEKIIYPVNNKWGQQGWTIIALGLIKTALLKELLTKAYHTVADKKK